MLPAGYRPPHLLIIAVGTVGSLLINGDSPVVVSGSTVVTPGGVLFSGGSTPTTAIAPLDAIDFRAAGAGTGITRAKKGAAHLDPAVLRALGIHLG